MKKRLGILLALSMLLVGIFVQAAAAGTSYYFTAANFNASDSSLAFSPTTKNLYLMNGTATGTVTLTLTLKDNPGTNAGSGANVNSLGVTYNLTASNGLTVSPTSVTFSAAQNTKTYTATVTVTATEEASNLSISAALGTNTFGTQPTGCTSATATVNVTEPVAPAFVDGTVQSIDVVVGTDNSSEAAATLVVDADDFSTISVTNLSKANAALAKYGLSLATTDGFSTDGTLELKGRSTKIGTINFTLILKDTSTKLTSETPFTVTIKGTAPTISLYNDENFDPTAPDSSTAEDSTNIHEIYDETNKVIYAGKDIAKAANQTDNSNIKIYVKGSNANSDLKVTAKIEPTGSGISATVGTATALADDTYQGKQAYVLVTLSETAKTKGTYTLTVTANNDELKRQGEDPVTQKYKFKIVDSPSISTSKATVEWGEEFELVVNADNATNIELANELPEEGFNVTDVTDISAALDADTLASDVGLTATADGSSITISGTWQPNSENSGQTAAAATSPTKQIALIAKAGSGEGSVYYPQLITLTLKAGAPEITIIEDALTFEYGERIAQGDGTSVAIAKATGAGSKAFYADATAMAALNAKLPEGLQIDAALTTASQPNDGDDLTLYVYGTPRYLTDSTGQSVTFSVTNSDGSNTIGTTKTSIPFIVTATGTTEPDITVGSKTFGTTSATLNSLPEGWAKKTQSFTDIVNEGTTTPQQSTLNANYAAAHSEEYTAVARDPAAITGELELFAEPGPLKWSANNLPSNVKLVVDKNDSRFAYLQFSDATASTASSTGFTKATTITTTTENGDKVYRSPYTITLTNPYLSSTKTITGNLIVWEAPKVTTKSLADLTVNKSWTPSVAFSGTPTEYIVEYAGDSTFDVDATWAGTNVESFKADGGEESVTFNTDTLKFSGTLDRIPKIKTAADTITKPKAFKVRITPTNYASNYEAQKQAQNYGEFTVNVKGVAPAFASTSKVTLADGGEAKIETTKGTPDITLTAYIAKNDVIKLFDSDANADQAIDTTAHYGFTFSQTAGDTYGTLAFNQPSDTTFAYKDLPITFVASNDEAKVTKVVKITVAGAEPKWEATSGTYEESNNVITVVDGTTVDNVYTADITSPYEIKITPNAKDTDSAKNGIYFTNADNVITFAGATTSGKATKTAFTMTATNLSTKQKATKKITFDSLQIPTLTTTTYSKEVALGKKLALKPTVKGTKGIKWRIADSSAVDEDTLAEYGLTVDTSKGGITGTAAKLTHSTGTYGTQKVTLEAYNETIDDAGVSYTAPTAEFEFGIYGAKPKVTTKSITYTKGKTYTNDDLTVKTNPLFDSDAKTDGTQYLQFSLANEPTGITIDPSTGLLDFVAGSLEATKGTTAKVTVTNVEPGSNKATVTSNLKFIINDATPSINAVEAETFNADASKKVTETLTAEVSDTTCTGDTKIKWAITKAPTKSQAKIKSTGNGKEATITITIPKNLTNDNDETITETITISATNQRTKDVGTKDVTYYITPVSTATEATAEDATFDAVADKTADAKAEEKAATGEGEVKFGKTRTAPTAAQLGAVQKVLGDGYVIAAVLPEIEVTAEGQYDFEVDLDEKVAAGAELVWFAFPESGKETEDDEIVDFYTKAGEDTKVVPEDHVLVVSPWLNAEVKYEPVIAVKVDAAEAEAVDAESVKEAAEEQAAE